MYVLNNIQRSDREFHETKIKRKCVLFHVIKWYTIRIKILLTRQYTVNLHYLSNIL